jgi:hypothetical protein
MIGNENIELTFLQFLLGISQPEEIALYYNQRVCYHFRV